MDIFPIVILNGRPAAGKSEVIDFLRGLPDDVRRERFRLGCLHELDDFPMLWTWFEEDDMLEKRFNKPRLHSTPDGYFLYEEMWHLLIERLSLDYAKLLRDQPKIHETSTALVEFSRGTEHGGYKTAYSYLSDRILEQAASLYIDVPYEESLRKNRRRFNPDKPDSILEHGLPDSKLERMYKEVDWETFSAGDTEYLHVRDYRVPYAVFANHDDVTTTRGPLFEARLEAALQTLWQRWRKLHAE
ncbi:MAG: hypothetical protein H7175_21575 [Burkholderiales bacterium]|nr:hypothetical protein [Anaerolineae bacterium]